MPFIVTSCASKVHRPSVPGRGKPVLICILACSLGFHAITSERGTYENRHFKNKASVALNPLLSLFYQFVGGNRRTDRPSTVTLAAHARRGLMTFGSTGTALSYVN